MFNKNISQLTVAFVVVAVLVLVFRHYLQLHNIDWQVLMGGNLFIYVITAISMSLLSSGMKAKNTHAFLTKAYSGILLKLFACAGAAFAYILWAGNNLNKGALFICMMLYLVYTFIENRVVLMQNKEQKNNG